MADPFAPSRWIQVTLCLAVVALLSGAAHAADWQWSVPDGKGRAYLWIPPACERVRAVVAANHNMIEQGVLEHPAFRKVMADLGIAEMWYVPKLDMEFDFHKGAGEHFQRVMDALADASGYAELRLSPVVPMGHSACATYPWNFAAWNPGRTLAVLSIHGDAPQTSLTGYGRPNVDWGDRDIDGVPGLMVMGEYEWSEERLTPALRFTAKHSKAAIAFLADAGRGHFDCGDATVAFLAMFVRKAAERRLPRQMPAIEASVPLTPINPRDGWRIDRWRKDQPLAAPAAPWSEYRGDPAQAFWCFDQEQAQATEAIYAVARGKLPQLVAFTQGGQVFCGEPCNPKFLPDQDGVTFHLGARFLDNVSGNGGNPARWAGLPSGSPLGHASGGGPIVISKIVGPGVVAGPDTTDTWQVRLDRLTQPGERHPQDLWLLASHPGDERHKSAVQQACVRITPNTTGAAQTITFPPMKAPAGAQSLKLAAISDAGLQVRYYVRDGPAQIVGGDILAFTPIPPRARRPVSVTVVAWQWGRSVEPRVQTAAPVEQTFFLAEP